MSQAMTFPIEVHMIVLTAAKKKCVEEDILGVCVQFSVLTYEVYKRL